MKKNYMRLYYKMDLNIDETLGHEEALNRADMLKNGKWVIMYYAYWCPHCVHLKPTFHEVARKCKMMGVKFAMIEASHLNNGMIENQAEVNSYPTLITRNNNVDSKEKYEGERTTEKLKKYIKLKFPVKKLKKYPRKGTKKKYKRGLKKGLVNLKKI